VKLLFALRLAAASVTMIVAPMARAAAWVISLRSDVANYHTPASISPDPDFGATMGE
jgi:hypothetical protein